MLRNYLAAGFLATTLLAIPASFAQVQKGEVKPGQMIFFNYYGEKAEAKVILEDSNGIKIEAKNPLTKQYDGSNTRYILWNEVMLPAGATAGGGAAAGGGGGGAPQVQPAATNTRTNNNTAAQPTAQPQATPAQSGGGGGTPRIGRYHMYGFPSAATRMMLVGWFDLNAGGTYQTKSGGTGTYSMGGGGIQWLSGPFKDQNFLGIVRIDGGGKTTRITLTKTDGGNDRMVAFCSAK